MDGKMMNSKEQNPQVRPEGAPPAGMGPGGAPPAGMGPGGMGPGGRGPKGPRGPRGRRGMPPGAIPPGMNVPPGAVPPGMEMPDPETLELLTAIMPDFPRWRKVFFQLDCFCVGLMFLLECVFTVIFQLNDVVERNTSGILFFLDMVIPFLVSLSILLVAAMLRKKLPETDMRQNLIPIFTLILVNLVLCLTHNVFFVTLATFCIPICMTTMFTNKQLCKLVTGVSMFSVVIVGLRQYLTISDAVARGRVIPQTLIMLVVIFVMGIVAMTALGMTAAQKQKLMDYARTIREEQRRAEAANIAKSAFLANMSHEIRTPINAILGMNEMVLRENRNEQIEEYAKNIHSAGSSLLSLVNDVLDISKIESGKLEIVDTNYDTASFIHDCYNMVAERAEKKGLTLNIECNPELPSQMRGDEARLRQIVTNLLSNAAKYTEKGSITLTVNGSRKEEQFLLNITVKDTGIGIKEENLSTLFSQFTRFDMEKNRNIEGTGLGLAITKQLIDLMNGDIQVQSIYGLGSSFVVTVPQQIIDGTPMGDFQKQYHDLGRENEKYHQSFEAPDARILVVDDVEVNLKVIVNLLKATRIHVETAKSGRQCISMMTQNVYDLVFLDHMMPEMDGIETYKKIKELDNNLNADTPVIMLTANAISGVREQYLGEGFADYVSKPVSGDKLEKVLLKYLPKEKVRTEITGQAEEKEEPVGKGLDGFAKAYPKADIKLGMDTCGDSEEIYIDILKTFAGDQKIDVLSGFFEGKDAANYQIIVHGVKSSALSVGLSGLSAKAKELEAAAKEENWEFLEREHPGFIAEYQQVVRAIEDTLND